MKKIYLVVNHAVNDYVDCGVGTKAFDTREKARHFFNQQVFDEKKAIDGFGWFVESDTDECFEAYEYGYYAQNHTLCEIRELVIE